MAAVQPSPQLSTECTGFKVVSHAISGSHVREYPGAVADESLGPLQLAIKQYIPLSNTTPQAGDITIIAAHGSGLPKELYEPLFCDLLSLSTARDFRIRAIWIADTAHQGKSGMLNEHNLGNDHSWFDHARDLLQMTNHFADQMPQPLVGLGHSMGAGSLMWLSLLHPRLFSSLILMEPVTGPDIQSCSASALTQLSIFRRDLWPTCGSARRAAIKAYGKRWDPRVLDRWISVAYRPLPTVIHPSLYRDDSDGKHEMTESMLVNEFDPPVTLTTTKHQEVVSYLRPNFNGNVLQAADDTVKQASEASTNVSAERATRQGHLSSIKRRSNQSQCPHLIGPEGQVYPFYRAEPVMIHAMLPYVRPPVLCLFGSKSPVSTPKLRHDKVQRLGTGCGGSGGAAAGRVREVVLEGSGHLLAMERATECAQITATWLGEEIPAWRTDQAVWKDNWDQRSLAQKQTVGSEWLAHLRMSKMSKL